MEIDSRMVGRFVLNSFTGCWNWVSINKAGYGMIDIDGKTYRAHRYSWEASNGKIPDGLCVCHKCDNPRCVNPDHLFLATHQENMKDMYDKGRGFIPPGAHASRIGHSRQFQTDPALIATIRDYWLANPAASLRDCAAFVGCSPMTAGKYKP